MKETHRTTIAAYVAAERHLRADLRGAKTLKEMAKEIGMTPRTVRRWLRRDHWELWLENWPSAEELWEASQEERAAARVNQPKRISQIALEQFCAIRANDGNYS
jgi:uncharacterized protein YjcR